VNTAAHSPETSGRRYSTESRNLKSSQCWDEESGNR
jgi:hypothetical protein